MTNVPRVKIIAVQMSFVLTTLEVSHVWKISARSDVKLIVSVNVNVSLLDGVRNACHVHQVKNLHPKTAEHVSILWKDVVHPKLMSVMNTATLIFTRLTEDIHANVWKMEMAKDNVLHVQRVKNLTQKRAEYVSKI